MRRIPAIIAALSMVLIGVLGLTVATLDYLGFKYDMISSKLPTDLTLLTLSAIASSLGIEGLAFRWNKEARIVNTEVRLADIANRLAEASPTRRVHGRDAIVLECIRLVGLTTGRIRSISIGRPDKIPMAFTNAVAGRLGKLRNEGAPARLDTVLVVPGDLFDMKAIQKSVAPKRLIYTRAGLRDLVTVRVIVQTHPIGFDILIVDNTHVLMAFTPIAGTDDVTSALVFEDQPEIAQEFVTWYDQRIMTEATLLPY